MQVSKQRTKRVFEYNYQEIRNRNRALMQAGNWEGRLSKTRFFQDPYGGKKNAEVHLSLRT